LLTLGRYIWFRLACRPPFRVLLAVSSVSSAEILHNGYNAAADRSDMLFRAAITAFAEIPRPGRAEIARLDDLVMPLLERVSPDSRRFAATTLAEHASAPPGLMRALASDLPEI